MPASNQSPASQRADNDPLQRLLDTVLVAVVRSPDDACLVDVAEALVAGGIDAIEITFTVPRAPQVLQRVADRLGDSVLLGAGTVLDAETARAAILAGARFVVSPVVAPEVVAMARRYACPAMAGALTPTEVFQAWQAGSDIVKVFPANIGGPGYLKALHGPLPQNSPDAHRRGRSEYSDRFPRVGRMRARRGHGVGFSANSCRPPLGRTH